MKPLAVVPLVLLVLLAAPAALASTWTIDPVHSSVGFRIRHMDVSWVVGRFNEFSGRIVFDPAKPAAGSVEMTVAAASVDTANAKRDAHLRNPDFLEVERYPEIAFSSTAWKKSGEGRHEVTGRLTLHGTTRTVTARVEFGGMGAGRGGKRLAGFLATFSVKRSDFGMGKMLGPIGDEVILTVAVEAVAVADAADVADVTEAAGADMAGPPASNRLAPDHAPTPYSAEEIRKGCPDGRMITYRVEAPGSPTILHTFRFGKGDEEGTELQVSQRMLEGDAAKEVRTIKSTWKALQSHGSYPSAKTTITTEAIETPAGTLACWLYTVRSEKDGRPAVSRYWFAKKRPGPPVRVIEETDGKTTLSMTLAKDGAR